MAIQGPFIDVDQQGLTIALNQLINQLPDALPPKVQAAGAVSPTVSGNYIITAGSAQALTLAAPVAGAVDGLRINVRSSTAFAHTLTATGLLQTGAAPVNLATFAASAGAGLELMAFNGKWIVLNSIGVTFT